MQFNDKTYKGPLFLDELIAEGIPPDVVRVKTWDGNLSVDILTEDGDGNIAQAVQDVAAEHDASKKTDGERLQEAREGIQNLRSVARNYADDVAALYGAVIAADAAGDTAQQRYNRIRDVMAGADAAFQSRFTQAMESETGIDIGSIGLLNLSISQTRDVNAFARRFANSLAMLLTM